MGLLVYRRLWRSYPKMRLGVSRPWLSQSGPRSIHCPLEIIEICVTGRLGNRLHVSG